jgi:hypothetical protein
VCEFTYSVVVFWIVFLKGKIYNVIRKGTINNMKILFTFLFFIPAFLHCEDTCNSTLWKHIYHPYRLIIQDPPCLTVTGVVYHIKKEPDGDCHIQLKLDSNYDQYLDDGNYERQNGCLLLEIICACKITQVDAIELCQDYENQITIPKKNDYIRVTGSYVYDKSGAHGWTEIHPVSKLEILK